MCVIELLSPVAAGVCCSLACQRRARTHPAVLARVPAVPISSRASGTSQRRSSSVSLADQEPLAPRCCSCDEERIMEICTPCPGRLTEWLARILKQSEEGQRKKNDRKKKTPLCGKLLGFPQPLVGPARVASTTLESSRVHPRSRPKVLVCHLFSLPYSMHLPDLVVTNFSPPPSRP